MAEVVGAVVGDSDAFTGFADRVSERALAERGEDLPAGGGVCWWAGGFDLLGEPGWELDTAAGGSCFALGDPDPGFREVEVVPGELVELADPDPCRFEGVERYKQVLGSWFRITRISVRQGTFGAWTLGEQFDSPATGRVGLNAGVVKDLLERADVGLDRGGGEPCATRAAMSSPQSCQSKRVGFRCLMCWASARQRCS
ncbi:MAG: hypothetical protein OXG37_04075 [Actinomycetia bacterium]|nr:hypothetical protein [Actinomycetes bacterium]